MISENEYNQKEVCKHISFEKDGIDSNVGVK